mgnify:CR=1 FL=1
MLVVKNVEPFFFMECFSRKDVNNKFVPNTYLLRYYDFGDFCKTIRYELYVRGVKQDVTNENGYYVSTAIDLINEFSDYELELWDYNNLKSSTKIKTLIELAKCLYPQSIDCKYCEGSWYGENEGKLKRISLKLQARWPWSIKPMTINEKAHSVKEITLTSEWNAQFFNTLESSVKNTEDKIVGVTQEPYDWCTWDIKMLCVLISASYIHELNFFGMLEGRIFDAGSDIDKFISKGYIKVKGFG